MDTVDLGQFPPGRHAPEMPRVWRSAASERDMGLSAVSALRFERSGLLTRWRRRRRTSPRELLETDLPSGSRPPGAAATEGVTTGSSLSRMD